MKKLLLGILSITCFLTFDTATAQENEAPEFSKLDASPMDLVIYRNQNEEPIARVIYSRPQKRNREVFGKLVPYGEVWRTGANEATELTLYKDMQIGTETISAGDYSLYTIPNEKEWTVILNKSTNTWGSYSYTDEKDLVRINVPVRKSPTTIEALSMAFTESNDGADLLIGWDESYIKVPFKTVN